MGNVLRIELDHGQVWPLSIQGWPIIKPKWESNQALNLHYSKDSSVFLQKESKDGIDIRFILITQEFVEAENLEIRK